MKARLALCAALLLSVHAGTAGAEPRQLSEKREGSYYALHLGLTVGGGVLTIGGEQLFGNHGPGPYWGSFYPDDLVQLNFSQAAAGMSDRLLMVAVLAPLFFQMGAGFDTAMGNATLIYGEAHAANLFITVTTKLAARRPRPYTHSPDPRIQEFADLEGGDAYVSFFSGHSSASFTAATAGSLLFAARSDDLYARHTLWGLDFLMAGITAQLRVRGGRHYRTDIWTGGAVGIGVGLLVPWLHDLDFSRVRPSEVMVAGAATALTMAMSEVIDFCAVLDVVGGCDLVRDVTVPVAPGSDRQAGVRYFVLPAVMPGGGGLQVTGDF
jgi:membrane-associated phospholipid phosphatase